LKTFGLLPTRWAATCTGIEAVFRIRDLAGLTRQTCVVGAVGASYSLTKGINPMRVAK
jgi:7,8-dihydropterin-6-yl-methyl-4-(beta-D-ribofuranosyl)aminobenzene 5'-phosphate synthase